MLSALKVSVEFATNYQAEIKYLEIELSFNCCYFIVGNKIFSFFKKWVFAFLDKVRFQGGGGSSSPNFWGGLLIKEGGSERFRFFFGGGGLVKRSAVNISGGGADTLEDTMTALNKHIQGNIKISKIDNKSSINYQKIINFH